MLESFTEKQEGRGKRLSKVLIGSIFLRHSVVGMDLAGFTLGGGLEIGEDVASWKRSRVGGMVTR